jgi:hypothetical protein
MRSVWGMNGLHADGAKASGFRSVVVAQFTAVSLQKDDRAFVKYNTTSRLYEGISISKKTGSELSRGSSSTNASTVYHLDPQAIYRNGWETAHIKGSNDSFIQIVSVFAICGRGGGSLGRNWWWSTRPLEREQRSTHRTFASCIPKPETRKNRQLMEKATT